MTGTRRLFLIRHGRVDFDSREFRTSPRGRQWNPPLSEEGRTQSESLAARLLLMELPAAVYASPFRRCAQTIEPFRERSGVEPVLDEEVGEVFIGECLGVRAELYEDIHLVRMEALAERRKIGHRRAWRDGAAGFAFAAARMRAIVFL